MRLKAARTPASPAGPSCWRNTSAETASTPTPHVASGTAMTLEYRRLGRPALRVSPLCLGTMNFGPLTTEANSFVIMDRALDLGINFFDTANRYGGPKGPGVTETIVGNWFAQGGGRREKVVLAT